jgi:hypothetical protein
MVEGRISMERGSYRCCCRNYNKFPTELVVNLGDIQITDECPSIINHVMGSVLGSGYREKILPQDLF